MRKVLLLIAAFSILIFGAGFQEPATPEMDVFAIAKLDTIYHPNFYQYPFEFGGINYIKIDRQEDTLLTVAFDGDKEEGDLFQGLSFTKYSEVHAYLDIVEFGSNYVDLTYSKRNRDYHSKVETGRMLGTSMLIMYSGLFRLTYTNERISVKCQPNVGEEWRALCDYEIIKRR